MTVLALDARSADQVRITLRRTIDRLVEEMAPAPGPTREAIRYELAWEMQRIAERTIDELALLVPPTSDAATPPDFWPMVSARLVASVKGTNGNGHYAEAEAVDFEVEAWAAGTPTRGRPLIAGVCGRCHGEIRGLAAAIDDALGEICVACRDRLIEEFERK
jgi:hypothetical protein